MKKILLTLFILFIQILLLAKPFPLSELKNTTILSPKYVDIYEDKTRNLELKDFIKSSDSFTKTNTDYFENLHANYFIKYEFVNNTSKNGKWVIELIDPHVNYITFIQRGKKEIREQGFLEPFDLRIYKHKNHVFDIDVAIGDTAICYLKLSSKSHVTFATKLQTNSYFSNYSLKEYLYLGLFYGFLFIMAIYNLILYFFTKMRTRIYYVLYVISALFNSLTEDGLGFQFLWPLFPNINTWLADFQPIIYLIFYTIYALSFLGLGQVYSRFKKTLISVVSAYSVLHLSCIFLHIPPKYWVPFYLIPFILIFYYSLKRFYEHQKSMRFLLLGNILIIISYLIFYFRMMGLVENSFYVVYFFNFAVTIEILLFSIAIGDKLRANQQEHLQDKELVIEGLRKNEELSQKVNRELEEKVSERTKALHEAKILLEKQAQEITAMNLQLDLSNRKLTKKVVEVSKKRVHGDEIDPEEFHELYPSKLECFLLLEEIKWKNGFKCRKCNNNTFATGSTFRSRRCTKCGTNETPTANTIFHGLRMPIEKAFYVFALVVQAKGEISSSDLEKKTGVNQKACWSFKQKIMDKLQLQKHTKNSWDQLIF